MAWARWKERSVACTLGFQASVLCTLRYHTFPDGQVREDEARWWTCMIRFQLSDRTPHSDPTGTRKHGYGKSTAATEHTSRSLVLACKYREPGVQLALYTCSATAHGLAMAGDGMRCDAMLDPSEEDISI